MKKTIININRFKELLKMMDFIKARRSTYLSMDQKSVSHSVIINNKKCYLVCYDTKFAEYWEERCVS